MGVITDIVIANKTDANGLTENLLDDSFEAEDDKGLLLEMLFELFSILSGRAISQQLQEEFVLLSAEDFDMGPWAYIMPSDLVYKLSHFN